MGNQGQHSILLRRSKTNQVGSGHWVRIPQEMSAAITTWLDAAQIKTDYLLRGIRIGGKVSQELGARQVSRIFKGLAQKAMLDPDIVNAISGHSMRVGAAQDPLIYGASLPQIIVKDGWVKQTL